MKRMSVFVMYIVFLLITLMHAGAGNSICLKEMQMAFIGLTSFFYCIKFATKLL